VYRWQELYSGLVMEEGKQVSNVNRNGSSDSLARLKVEMCLSVADEVVVVSILCESRE